MTKVSSESPPGVIRLFLRMGGWAVLIVGALLLILSLIGQAVVNTAARFEEEGRQARATVLEKYTRESRDSDGDRRTEYYFVLRFETQAGETVQVAENVDSGLYRAQAVGGTFPLLYLESAPERVEVRPGSNRQGARVLQIVSLVFGLIWLGLIWLIGGWAVAAVRARRYGRREEAEVVEVRRTNVKVNNRARYRLIWRIADGRTGKSLLRRADDLRDYKAGQTVVVFHGIRHMWWDGDVGQRLAE